MAKKSDQHPTQLAGLFGMRLVVCIETQQGSRLDEELVKELTGGDAIRARRMREDYWEFDPTHKAILVTNHKPEIRGTDEGIWRRPKLVPFTKKFWDPDKGESGPPHLRADKDLLSKLRAEAPGILAWCVQGCLDWQRDGLRIPEVVRAATEEYRNDQDLVGRFLEELCIRHAEYRIRAGILFTAFKAWANNIGEEKALVAQSQRAFGENLTGKGFVRQPSNGTWYKGLALRQDTENLAQS
jgi:putative DNA primase/helicase